MLKARYGHDSMTPERHAKFRRVLAARQPDLTILYEDLYKVFNLAALARTCETLGIDTIHAVSNYRGNPKAGRGANRWVTRVRHPSIEVATTALKEQGFTIYATHLGQDAVDYREVDFTKPTAIMLGNEDEGLSDEALALADGNIVIPLAGAVEALNVSVAAAVILFEAKRQRDAVGMYDRPITDPEAFNRQLFEACYPRAAARLRSMGEAYPPLDDTGIMQA
ncbi:MAG: tRNA (guanosine-2'-O-)-methyltransferase [Candidatus Omnitrophota bacterium]